MPTALDHLVIGATTLQQGVDYVREVMGIDMPFGGIHHSMGTHNHLVRLGGEVFLEIIAINPEGKPPACPRWYGLDDPLVRQQIAREPTLLTWVINTDNLHDLVSHATVPAGTPEQVVRDHLSWYFAIPEDGRLLAAGMLPYMIQWQTSHHPSHDMAERDCKLQRLEIHHPMADWLTQSLRAIEADSHVEVVPLAADGTAKLVAIIETPNGIYRLESAG